MKKILTISFFIIALSACTQNISPNTYNTAEVGVASKVLPGTIIAKRKVTINNNSGAGGLAGATAGATAGTLAGNSAQSAIIGAVGGAVVGGVLGNGIDKGLNKHQAYEYIIKLNDKSVVSIVQAEDLNLAIHQHVLIIYGATTRIIPDDAHA